jgi:hypothetical protein
MKRQKDSIAPVFMGSAADPRIDGLSIEPLPGNSMNVSAAASHDIDAGIPQHIHRSVPHVSREHELHTHRRQCHGNIRFASASNRRWNDLLGEDFFVVVNREDSEEFTMSEMAVDIFVLCR